MSDTALPLSDVARLREGAYRLLALLFLPRESARWDRAVALATELRGSERALASLGAYVQLRRLLDATLDPQAERTAGTDAYPFGIGPDGVACAPYEASYLGSAADASAGLIAAQLEHTYRREGLHLSRALNERPDHAAVELEFMAFLCANEGAAWAQAAHDGALRALARERAFLDLHLARWIGALAGRMRTVSPRALYVTAADAIEALVLHDRDLTAALIGQVEQLHVQAARC